MRCRTKRYRGCRFKVRYGTREEAESAQPAQHAYLCASCLCWHLATFDLPRGAR